MGSNLPALERVEDGGLQPRGQEAVNYPNTESLQGEMNVRPIPFLSQGENYAPYLPILSNLV